MNYYREIINSKDIGKVKIPEDLIDKKVELIILPWNEKDKQKTLFNLDEFRGVSHIENIMQ